MSNNIGLLQKNRVESERKKTLRGLNVMCLKTTRNPPVISKAVTRALTQHRDREPSPSKGVRQAS